MLQLSHTDAEKLTAEQATELVRILDLQARWENHRDDPAKSASSTSDLHARQRAFDAFQAAWRSYAAKYHNARFPEPTQNLPHRLAIWCQALCAVFQRAEGAYPADVMAKVFRLTDRTAARLAKEPIERGTGENVAAAVGDLDRVIAWCGELAPHAQLAKVHKEDAA